MTVPLVLALGVGIAAAVGNGDSGLSGFGIVTLASLFPIAGVLLLTLFLVSTTTLDEIIAAAHAAKAVTDASSMAWYQRSPGLEIILGFPAILPLVTFLFLVLKFVLREKLPQARETVIGIALTIIGMCIFNIGLTYGLSKLGGAAGSLVPSAFMGIEGIEKSPLYAYGAGLVIALVFAWVLGFGNATNAVEGFGILCMASIGPIISVMITGLWSQHVLNRQAKAAEKVVVLYTRPHLTLLRRTYRRKSARG